MLKLKDSSVNVWALEKEMQPVLKSAANIWLNIAGVDLVVTSARDGFHSPGSLHYYGYAVDLRTWTKNHHQMSRDDKEDLADRLRHVLSQNYDVIVKNTHIHVEYDIVKAGLV